MISSDAVQYFTASVKPPVPLVSLMFTYVLRSLGWLLCARDAHDPPTPFPTSLSASLPPFTAEEIKSADPGEVADALIDLFRQGPSEELTRFLSDPYSLKFIIIHESSPAQTIIDVLQDVSLPCLYGWRVVNFTHRKIFSLSMPLNTLRIGAYLSGH